jgi:hypothetical protein
MQEDVFDEQNQNLVNDNRDASDEQLKLFNIYVSA